MQGQKIVVRCRCGQRLFDLDPDTDGTITTKCPRCKAVLAVTIKHGMIVSTEQIATRA